MLASPTGADMPSRVDLWPAISPGLTHCGHNGGQQLSRLGERLPSSHREVYGERTNWTSAQSLPKNAQRIGLKNAHERATPLIQVR